MNTNTIAFPAGKDFAFTVIDDTDDAFLDQIKFIYDLLFDNGIISTKTVWVYPPNDKRGHKGDSLQNEKYLLFIRELISRKYEIALHNVGSGYFKRNEIINGLEDFKNLLGFYPKLQINHSYNPDNIYSGSKRFLFPLNYIIKLLYPEYTVFEGDDPHSDYFWGDIHKRLIKYSRNHEIDHINTFKKNPYIPYKEKRFNKYSNYWFSASFAPNSWAFNNLVTKDSIDRLERERGICILYTHFGHFSNKGELDKDFVETINYLGKKSNCWFIPVSELLDYILNDRKINGRSDYLPLLYNLYLQIHHLKTRFKYRYFKKIDDRHYKKSIIKKSN